MLQECYAAAVKGRAPMVLVEGEAGLGKTHLLRSFMAWAEQEGAYVIYAPCQEAETGLPYGVVIRMIRTLLRGSAANSTNWAAFFTSTLRSQPWFPVLLRLVPELAQGLGMLPVNEWPKGFFTSGQVHEGAVEFIKSIARTAPVVLVIDDLHWADTATLDLRAAVYRRLRSWPVLMVGSYRPEEVDQAHPLHRLRTMLLRMNGLRRVRLHPLESTHVQQLVGALSPDAPVDGEMGNQPWEGNPAYLVAWARLQSGGQAPDRTPRSLREINGLLIAQMEPDARQVLEAMAVLGTEADAGLLADVAGLPPARTGRALQQLVAQGDLADYRGKYVVVNISLARTMYELLDEGRRRDLHLRAGQALESRHQDLLDAVSAMLTRHYDVAEEPTRALRYAIMAGAWARRLFALEEAQELYWNALSYAVLLGEGQIQTAIHEALGDIHAQMGHHRAALEHFHAALGGARSPSRQALIQVHVARSLGAMGEYEQAKDALQSALQQVIDQQAPHLDGIIWLHLAWVEEQLGDQATALSMANRALRTAKVAEDSLLEADAAFQLALLCWHQGDLKKAQSLCRHSLHIREQVGDAVGCARVWNYLGLIERDRGQLQAARHCFAMSAEAYHQAGEWLAEASVRAHWGQVCAAAYALAESVEQFRQAFSLYHEFRGLESDMEMPLWTRPRFD